ncbi:hypothetical protein [Micromonospora sp. NPDC007230]|uniref:hypothetical protein n=1 Tax=Micromonospora sp. NPDC007230 TaxID=3364237 RepID=UPI00367673B8
MSPAGPGGFLEMQTAMVGPQLRVLAETGTTLAGDWRGAEGAATAAEGGIGADVLGQAFRAVYLPDSQAVRQNASAIPPLFQALTDVGMRCLQDYQAADQRSAAAFPPPR